jgi:hypothetical protein
VRSPAAARSSASPRRLPTVVLLLLAALSLAFAPAIRGDEGSVPSAPLGSPYSAVHAGDPALGTLPARPRVAVRAAAAARHGVERPTVDATLPRVVVAIPLLGRSGRCGADEDARAFAHPGSPARGPPASAAA